MSVCAKCGSTNEVGNEFCQNCGASILATAESAAASSRFAGTAALVGIGKTGNGALTFIERTIYFRIARVFSWLLLVLSLMGLVGGAYLAAGSIRNYLKGEDSVSAADVKVAIATNKAGNKARGDGQPGQTQLDPKAEGLLTTETAEIFNFLSAEDQNKLGGKENFRMSLLQAAATNVNDGGVDAQIAYLREMKRVVNEVQPQSDRYEGIRAFIALKQSYRDQAAARKAEAEMLLLKGGGAVLSFAALITLLSMVLVLLAIERNTRNA